MKKIYSIVILLISLNLPLSVFAGGSSLTLTSHGGSKTLLQNEKDQVLYDFSILPTASGDVTLDSFNMQCGQASVVAKAYLELQGKKFAELEVSSDAQGQSIVFNGTQKPLITPEGIRLQIKVDVKKLSKNEIAVCLLKDIKLKSISSTKMYDFSTISDRPSDVEFLIRVIDQTRGEKPVQVTQKNIGPIETRYGVSNLKILSFSVTPLYGATTIDDMYIMCTNTSFRDMTLRTTEKKSRVRSVLLRNSSAPEHHEVQGVLFENIGVKIAKGKTHEFTVTGDLHTYYYADETGSCTVQAMSSNNSIIFDGLGLPSGTSGIKVGA